ncbi:MAG: 2-oxoacid:acceptor oxidoreductase subunit alpha [Rikenellaceae bacterium]
MEGGIKSVESVVIRFSGDSGDGMQMTGTLFTDTAAFAGNSVSTFPDFPSEIRAPKGTISGVSGFQLQFGSQTVTNPGDYCDVLVVMNPAALRANAKWAKRSATIICDGDSWNEKEIAKAGYATLDPAKELGIEDYNIIYPNITSLATDAVAEAGLDRKSALKCKNMFALGLCLYLYDKETVHGEEFINKKFGAKKPQVAQANILAIKAGYNYGANTHAFANRYNVDHAPQEKGRYRSINGNVAVAWGFCAAAEKSNLPLFCGSYPITPATVILEELAKRKDLGVKTYQAEDEIAGICSAIGAAFAGNLAVTTTSGPGLSLKSEAMGLAVITELPLVVVDVQRGGPSTGLPTKTEQSDLMQALYGRNGECPMVVIAASSPTNCFDYAFQSCKIALEHMTPVILLSDGFIANGSESWKIPSMADYPAINAPIIKEAPEGGYAPYIRNQENLARYWAAPGTPGLEHRIGGLEKDSRTGSVSHDPANHQEMVRLRAEKVAKVADVIPAQEVIGETEGKVLVVGWGGTHGHLLHAVSNLQKEGQSISLCQFNYINPLPKNTEEVFSKFEKIIVCELNEGQFATYLRSNFAHIEFMQYNKTQGLPFTVVELEDKFRSIL